MGELLKAGDIDVHVEGEGDRIIVMVHGWPDTWRLWDRQVAALSATHRCARFSLPGFEPGQPARAWSLEELIAAIRAVVLAVGGGRPVTMMLHDWGCAFGYQFCLRHPALVERIVGIDIGDAATYWGALSLKQKAMVAGYQGVLAAAWAIGGGLGDRITRRMARAMRCKAEQGLISAKMNYPYFIAWTGAHGSYRGMRPFRPTCPMLFVYGRRKPFMFHAEGWARALAGRPGSAVVPFDTGHWVMVDDAPRFNRVVGDWLAQTV